MKILKIKKGFKVFCPQHKEDVSIERCEFDCLWCVKTTAKEVHCRTDEVTGEGALGEEPNPVSEGI